MVSRDSAAVGNAAAQLLPLSFVPWSKVKVTESQNVEASEGYGAGLNGVIFNGARHGQNLLTKPLTGTI